MKKPDPTEPRDKRLPFMASQSELDAIDEYRFANRISTRADAMRRLILAGLAAEEVHAPVNRAVTEAPKGRKKSVSKA